MTFSTLRALVRPFLIWTSALLLSAEGPGATSGAQSLPNLERLGQCSRRTSLVISEIMYHPVNRALEFVEIFNSRDEPQDVSNYRLSGSIEFTVPAGTVIAGQGFLVVAKSPQDVQSTYALSGVLGPYFNSLPHNSGTVRLLNQAGGVLLEVNYQTTPPWPVAPDGAGHPLVLARPSFGEDNVLAWSASDAVGGSPGKLDPVTVDPLRSVMVNELLAHSELPLSNFIELYNSSGQALDLSGCSLSDDPKQAKFALPAGTTIPAFGFLVYDQAKLPFALNPAGGTIYLRNADGTRVIEAVRYEGQQNGVALGRVPDGSPALRPLASPTPGAANRGVRAPEVVINEIMYAPVSLNDDDQFVELYNRTTQAIDLGGWKFTAGIKFTFPSPTLIPPDGYMVVARNSAHLLTHYSNLNTNNLVGDFTGTLAHKGERLALAKPDLVTLADGQGGVTTNVIYPVINEVTYGVGGRWGEWSHAGGSSLELIDPNADNALAPNWADSDETHKAPWTIISATGTIDNGDVAANQLQALIQGVGECLLDDVQVLDPNGNNLIANSDFESGAAGWTAEGTEKFSSLENGEGYNSAQSYHLRAAEKGDNQVNRVRTPLTSALAAGTSPVTIRAAVRWLKGDPEVLLRLRGNWLECAAELPTPLNAGTPGARNSRYLANAPPAIGDVQHAPVLPAANQPMVVSARVSDPDGLSSVLLNYRLDPNLSYSTVTMTDDGTGGDAVAGDGIFSATIPGQAAGTMIAFYIQSTDNAPNPATASFPNDAPAREALIRVGEVQPRGDFPVYRLWMTQATLNTWNKNNRLDNTYYDVTFVLGDQRVIYNAGARFKGSPYISPGYCGATCGRCGYSISLPADDLFLGEEELVLDWPGGHGGETTALQEQMCYWIADKLNLPWSHRHTIRLHINGVTDDARQATFEAVVQPAASFVKEWSPNDSNGELFKIERAFEFSDSDQLVADPEPRLQIYTTTGGAKKTEHYRWNWMFRSTDRRDDYTNIFALVDAVNAAAPEPYTKAVSDQVDLEEWMGIFATEHIIVNFDAYGHEIGKNMYAYKPDHGKWQLYMFDLDWAMLAAPLHIASYAASSAPLFNAEDPTITRMFGFPPFARAYWRTIQNAVNGPLDPANCNPVIDAKSQALFANGIVWCDGARLTDGTAVKTWFSQRRTFLQTQLATVAAPFAIDSTAVSNDVAVINGRAPVEVKTILVNGSEWPVTWTSVNAWTTTLPLQPGTNALAVTGVDVHGQPIAGAAQTVQAVYNSPAPPSPVGQVVLNEIMFHPVQSGAEYVEVANASGDLSFDLSGWQLPELGYSFPPGSLIGPNQFLVLAADRGAFAAAYGGGIPVFDTFDGTLHDGGQTLSLIRPGSMGTNDLIVAKVRYEDALPWPAAANTGSSLQLIDPTQDISRAGNWSAVTTNIPPTPQWQYVTLTGIATKSTLLIGLLSAGDVYVDDLKLVAGTVPEAGVNYLADGDFESPLTGTWTVSPNMSGSTLSQTITHSGNASLHVIASSGGPTIGQAIWQNTAPLVTNATYTLSYWYLAGASPTSLLIRLSGSAPGMGHIYSLQNVQPATASSAAATPGAANSVRASLPAFPPLWLNEVQAENVTGITNGSGQRTAWVELFNAGPSPVSLAGLYLANDYTNLTAWSFPPTATIGPNEFKVIFTDGQTALSTADELHTSFSLTPGTGSLALSRLVNGQAQVIDYLNYVQLAPDSSYGSLPDGQSFARQVLVAPTPGSSNTGVVLPPVVLSISSANNQLSVSWPTVAGRSYRLQYKDDLGAAAWTTVGADLTGTGKPLSFAPDISMASARFYRVVVLAP
jgi:hypothetical protein